jgi:hypothetical protein
MSEIEYVFEGGEAEARAWLQVMAAVREYMHTHRDVITSEVGMHVEGDEEGAKYWAQGLASDVEAVVLGVFNEWEES